MRDSRAKVGRNAPCPCKSGKKYKKCCMNNTNPKPNSPYPFDMEALKLKLQKDNAAEIQRTQQQGKGRPIISTIYRDYRVVAVGSMTYFEKEAKCKTFHDFLNTYILRLLDKKWLKAEHAKAETDRHPIINWLDLIQQERSKVLEQNEDLISVPVTGAVFAYFTLAYNLYLIAHNNHLVLSNGLHERLVNRLKMKEYFYSTFYETMVTAVFIKAGFKVELVDENDLTSQHPEFIATSIKTGRKYSVEAKHRKPGREHTNIRHPLYKAIKKDLEYERVIFIDLNIPDNVDGVGRIKWLDDIIAQIRGGEEALIDGKPAPPAYVFVTNYPFLYNLNSCSFAPAAVAHGFKMPDFNIDIAFTNLREALKSRDNHIDMLDLMKAMQDYDSIPQTFDGEIPEYAFGVIKEPRFIIGNHYLVPDSSGKEVEGVLEDAAVLEAEKKVYGSYRLVNGKRIIAASPISDKEIEIFKRHPETFFGTPKHAPRKPKDILDWYDFFYETYSKSTKEKLLEFMSNVSNFDLLKKKTQEELAMIYCESLAYSAMRDVRNNPVIKL